MIMLLLEFVIVAICFVMLSKYKEKYKETNDVKWYNMIKIYKSALILSGTMFVVMLAQFVYFTMHVI